MKKYIPAICILSILVLIGAGCTTNNSPEQKTENGTLTVVTSFYPLTFLAEKIGGDTVTVYNMTPTGVDAHDFEPSPKDVGLILESDLFVFQGSGLDPWAEDIANEMNEHTVNITSHLDLMGIQEGEEKHADEAYEEDTHGAYDPHTWLDPVLMQKETEVIRDALIAVDPTHADAYTKNAQQLIDDLEILDTEYRAGLKNCTQNSIVTSHDAFGYVGARYGFTIIAVSGISPDDEPSAKELAEITNHIRTEGVGTIFSETLLSEKIAETIAKETGAEIATLNPLEGLSGELKDSGADYFSEMRKNLDALQIGLECK